METTKQSGKVVSKASEISTSEIYKISMHEWPGLGTGKAVEKIRGVRRKREGWDREELKRAVEGEVEAKWKRQMEAEAESDRDDMRESDSGSSFHFDDY